MRFAAHCTTRRSVPYLFGWKIQNSLQSIFLFFLATSSGGSHRQFSVTQLNRVTNRTQVSHSILSPPKNDQGFPCQRSHGPMSYSINLPLSTMTLPWPQRSSPTMSYTPSPTVFSLLEALSRVLSLCSVLVMSMSKSLPVVRRFVWSISRQAERHQAPALGTRKRRILLHLYRYKCRFRTRQQEARLGKMD